MTRQEIESHRAFRYISGLTGAQRHYALTGSNGLMAEEMFNVKLEEWAFTRLSEVPDDCARLSVADPFRNVAYIMVFMNIKAEVK